MCSKFDVCMFIMQWSKGDLRHVHDAHHQRWLWHVHDTWLTWQKATCLRHRFMMHMFKKWFSIHVCDACDQTVNNVMTWSKGVTETCVSRIRSHGVIETYLCSAWSIWLKDDLDEVPRCNFSEVHAALHVTLITLKRPQRDVQIVQTHAWSAVTRLPSRQMSEHWRIECCKRVNWRVLGEVC